MRSSLAKPNVSRACAILAAVAMASCLGTSAGAQNGSVTYTYDALGRVTSASYDTNVIVIYSYDANGNRTQQVINVNTGTLCWDGLSGSCTTFHWDNGLWGP